MTKREVFHVRVKSFYFIVVRYPDWYFGARKMGPRRYSVDLGKFRLMFENY